MTWRLDGELPNAIFNCDTMDMVTNCDTSGQTISHPFSTNTFEIFLFSSELGQRVKIAEHSPSPPDKLWTEEMMVIQLGSMNCSQLSTVRNQ